MLQRFAYRLKPPPGGGFHLGREGLDQEESAESFPSDSLFAALVATMVVVQGARAAEDFLSLWPQNGSTTSPPFRLSSLFPYAGDVPLLPMPRLRVNLDDLNAHERSLLAKKLKKLAYVSPGVLALLLDNQPIGNWLPSGPDVASKGILLQEGRVWLTRDEIQKLPASFRRRHPVSLFNARLWSSTPVPRVAIDRVTNSSAIYRVGRTVFAEGCGLWLLVEAEAQRDLLEMLLDHLADTGIGGERAAGYGGFTRESMDVPELPATDGAVRVMTLSRYNPTAQEIRAGVFGKDAAYELVEVGGWLATPGGTPQRRKRLRMIEAGSVLVSAVPIVGQIVDVRPEYPQAGAPDHPVYRSGVALTIGVREAIHG